MHSAWTVATNLTNAWKKKKKKKQNKTKKQKKANADANVVPKYSLKLGNYLDSKL